MTFIALGFILFWLIIASGSWVLNLPKKHNFWVHTALWLSSLVLAAAVGYGLDMAYMDKPHGAWTALDFYLTLISVHAVFAVPGFLYWLNRK